MKNSYKIFRESVKTITQYYMLLVEETKSQRLVGSTNEWVLDNYYMISEQEKVMKEELKGIQRGEWKVDSRRIQVLWDLLENYLRRCHFQVDKALLFRYLTQVQQRQKDYLAYPEVTALLPLAKAVLISELAALCRRLEEQKSYLYKPTDKSQADMEHLNKAAMDNLLMMNIFNSLKKLTKLPMAELLDAVSFSEKMLKGEKAGMYDQMQDKTKEDYRGKVVRLCRKQKTKEYDMVKALVAAADEKGEHVGWQLFPPKRWNARAHGYITIISLASLALAFGFASAATWGHGFTWVTALLTVIMCVPMSQVVIDLFNWLLGKLHHPSGTFKLKFKDGLIPDEYATMVIMPTILKNRAKVEELMGVLEVYYLSNINRGSGHSFSGAKGQNLYYTLVGDAASYKEEDAPWDDEVVEAGLAKVKELNEKYGAPIFNFVYRRRAWSDGERTWLGHERKRGAILHFNDLLLGQTSDEDKARRFRCETVSQWLAEVENATRYPLSTIHCPIKFIITLDTDTELVLYSAQKLIGAMAHPLNQAVLSPDGRRVDRGYGIMQPRVNVDVEVTNKSRYAQLMAGLGGLDVYTTASFELYQDIFNEGSFCGKGIYDLRVFQQVLKGTFPENLILSHDLLEGCHIRCGLINDVEVFDDNPSNYIDDAKRHHRWTRGDWQIISWLGGKVRNERGERVKNQVNTIGRWKIFDNLRRSVLSLALLIVLFVGFVGVTGFHPVWFLVAALVAVASPIVFFIIGQITTLPRFGKRYKYYMTLMRGFRVILYRSLVQFALLPKEAWMYTDAAVRACWRMWFSHRDLLAWITSDEAAKSTKGTLGDYIGKFWFNYVASAILAVLFFLGWGNWVDFVAMLFCVVVWCAAPFLMYRLGRKFPQEKKTLNEQETAEVRQVAQDTWHFFDSLITEENNWLIPDNYQVGREPLTDYKTSPTNIGYSMTAVISAAELGFITQKEAIKRLEHIIDNGTATSTTGTPSAPSRRCPTSSSPPATQATSSPASTPSKDSSSRTQNIPNTPMPSSPRSSALSTRPTSPSYTTPNSTCSASATTRATTPSSPITTTTSPPRRDSPRSSPSPKATRPTNTGSASTRPSSSTVATKGWPRGMVLCSNTSCPLSSSPPTATPSWTRPTALPSAPSAPSSTTRFPGASPRQPTTNSTTLRTTSITHSGYPTSSSRTPRPTALSSRPTVRLWPSGPTTVPSTTTCSVSVHWICMTTALDSSKATTTKTTYLSAPTMPTIRV